MIKTTNKEGGWWAPLGWLVLILAILWVLWYFTGGPERAAQQNNAPFLNPETGEIYDGVGR